MPTPLQQVVERISNRQREMNRLTQSLVYYEWLAAHGMSWDTVKGVADVTDRRKRRADPAMGHSARQKLTNCYSFKLADGSIREVDNVPFEPAVIFNRPYPTI